MTDGGKIAIAGRQTRRVIISIEFISQEEEVREVVGINGGLLNRFVEIVSGSRFRR